MIAEVRGEGLLIGLRAVVPNGDLVTELRAEKLLTVAAGDNVVRLLPPLIIGEEEMSAALGMIDRACARLAKSQSARKRPPDESKRHPAFRRSHRYFARGIARDDRDPRWR